MNPARLAGIVERLPKLDSPNLIVGMETMDDAGVYKLSDDTAIVQTVDFFYPIVNDPRSFGRIAAANSLSDIWAMGAKAITAMNHLAYPAGMIPPEAIEELLRGANEKLHEAEVALVGGHTLEQTEMVFGLSVTGTIHPDKATSNASAKTGQKIVLTKPVGTGIYCNAHRVDGLSDGQYESFVGTMERLNMYAAETIESFPVGAVTDVTGFGLLGHAMIMARFSGRTLKIDVGSVPLLPDLMDLIARYNPQGVCKCKQFVQDHMSVDEGVDSLMVNVLSEAQTSGGLLVTVDADAADELVQALREAGDCSSVVIGEVGGPPDGEVYLEMEP
ncbi:selenide, water dikinase SelD [Candidatus Fermentibacteria bacterium]|nr:selenide, water dikinase SelD [Candidatus Fermentibacteria bacterium]